MVTHWKKQWWHSWEQQTLIPSTAGSRWGSFQLYAVPAFSRCISSNFWQILCTFFQIDLLTKGLVSFFCLEGNGLSDLVIPMMQKARNSSSKRLKLQEKHTLLVMLGIKSFHPRKYPARGSGFVHSAGSAFCRNTIDLCLGPCFS